MGKKDNLNEEKECFIFEPQTWRPKKCKNCFLDAKSHKTSKIVEIESINKEVVCVESDKIKSHNIEQNTDYSNTGVLHNLTIGPESKMPVKCSNDSSFITQASEIDPPQIYTKAHTIIAGNGLSSSDYSDCFAKTQPTNANIQEGINPENNEAIENNSYTILTCGYIHSNPRGTVRTSPTDQNLSDLSNNNCEKVQIGNDNFNFNLPGLTTDTNEFKQPVDNTLDITESLNKFKTSSSNSNKAQEKSSKVSSDTKKESLEKQSKATSCKSEGDLENAFNIISSCDVSTKPRRKVYVKDNQENDSDSPFSSSNFGGKVESKNKTNSSGAPDSGWGDGCSVSHADHSSRAPLATDETDDRDSSNRTMQTNSSKKQSPQQRTDGGGDDTRRRRRRNIEDYECSRDEAMIEGSRMLAESLREKCSIFEDQIEKLDREKVALADLLTVRKAEYKENEEEYVERISSLEDAAARLEAENDRLSKRMNLSVKERGNIRDQESELLDMRLNLVQADRSVHGYQLENQALQQEINDLHLEIEEMHDQFREDEALEFREIQKELEATAKNCRILQFKLRKADRRNDQMEGDRLHYEEKIRQLEKRLESDDKGNLIRELEEELRMAKEVSVRLHEELETVEERRIKTDEDAQRVKEYLKETEDQRVLLQRDCEFLTNEVETLRETQKKSVMSRSTSLEVPSERPMLRKIGSQGSTEYDMETLMRDLADHLERENDLKEQLINAEEDIKHLRKNISVMEDENESLNLQLQKMSAAKGKLFGPKKGEMDKPIITEEQHELSVQLGLLENENSILCRRIDELEKEKYKLESDMKFFHERQIHRERFISTGSDEDRPYEERIEEMAKDIDDLKYRLIQKDQQVEMELEGQQSPSLRQRGKLKKSKSLDCDSAPDTARQLEILKIEAGMLREKINFLENESEKINAENKKLQLNATTKIPSIHIDDAAIHESESRENIRLLERKVVILKQRLLRHGETEDQIDEMLRKLKHSSPISPVSPNEGQFPYLNNISSADLDELLAKNKKELLNIIDSIHGDLSNTRKSLETREEEIDKLEEEIKGYQDDIDSIMETYRVREKELTAELEMLQNKNSIFANLLDMVVDRSDSKKSDKSSIVKKSSSTISGNSRSSLGSDDVFTEGKIIHKNWDDQFLRRIACLEQLLEEERDRVLEAEKKTSLAKVPHQSLTDDAKLHVREREILQKENEMMKSLKLHEREKELLERELTLCQKQLSESHDQVRDLKEMNQRIETVNKTLKVDHEQRLKQIEKERREKEKDHSSPEPLTNVPIKRNSIGSIGDKPPITWRFEKQDLEKQIKELLKKHDEMDRKLRLQASKLKASGEDKEAKLKEQIDRLKTEKKELQDEIDSLMKQSDENDQKVKELNELMEKKKKQWDVDREILEESKQSVQKEVLNLQDVIKQKDNIINEKTELVNQKDAALKEREEVLITKENIIKSKEEILAGKIELIKRRENEFASTSEKLMDCQAKLKEMESKLKELEDSLKAKDMKITEKDDLLERLYKEAAEKEEKARIMENSFKDSQVRVKEAARELVEIKGVADDYASKAKTYENGIHELEEKLKRLIKDRDKETSSLVIQREKVENQLEFMTKENKYLIDELNLLKKNMKDRDDDWERKEKRFKKESDSKDKQIRTMELTAKDGSTTATLKKEITILTKDKQRLEDVIKKLREELDQVRSKDNQELSDLRKVLYDSKKKLEEKTNLCDQLEKEKEQIKEQGLTSKIDEIHLGLSPSTKAKKEGNQQKALQQEVLHKAEKQGLEELYENRIQILRDQLAQAQFESEGLRAESDTAKKFVQESNAALAVVKSAYESDQKSWTEEKNRLADKVKKSNENRNKLEESEQNKKSINVKMMEVSAKNKELETELNISQSKFKAEKTDLIIQICDLTKKDQSKCIKKGEVLKETEKLTKNLEKQLEDQKVKREKEIKAIVCDLDKARKEWQKEKVELDDRHKKLEEKGKENQPLQKTLIDLQYKLHSYRESWLREKSDLQKQVEDSKCCQLEEKHKFVELMSEVRKVKNLVPTLQEGENGNGNNGAEKQKTDSANETVDKRKVAKVIDNVSSALEHMSKLAEDLNSESEARKTKRITNNKTLIRSSSTNNAEVDSTMPSTAARRDSFLHTGTKSMDIFLTASQTSPCPSPIHTSSPSNSKDNDLNLVPSTFDSTKQYNRSFSETEPDPSVYASLDRQSRSRQPARRSVVYSSGTQSAYGSRDTSPASSFRSGPYPAPPPSFLITPPKSPRHFTPSPHANLFTSSGMMELYDKLGKIERIDSVNDVNSSLTTSQAAAITKERTATMRLLTKSASCDDGGEDDPSYSNQNDYDMYDQLSNIEILRLSPTYEDAALSETLPASIRFGQLVITPGVEQLTKTFAKNIRRTGGGKSPKSIRREFYDNYGKPPSHKEKRSTLTRYASENVLTNITATEKILDEKLFVTDKSIATNSKTENKKDQPIKKPDKPAFKASVSEKLAAKMAPLLRKSQSVDKESEAQVEVSRIKRVNIFSSIKDKRSVFSSKSAASFDSSKVGTEIINAAVSTALPPAAPVISTEKKSESSQSKSSNEEKPPKVQKHKRSSSIDFHSIFKVKPRARSRESSQARESDR